MPNIVSRRPSLRLNAEAYADISAICSVTIGVKQRARVFQDGVLAAAVVNVLEQHALRTQVSVWAYCVMPDHVHLVLTPSANCDIVTFVGQFKSLALRPAWKLGVAGSFWQTGFWDRFVRRGDDADRLIKYVMENPVRAGLVKSWQDYAFSGGVHVLPSVSDDGDRSKSGGRAPALQSGEQGPTS